MQPVSQLLLRNREHFPPGEPVTWLNPPADAPWRELAGGEARLFCQDYGAARALEAAGANVQFGDFPDFSTAGDRHLILSLPRGKPLLEMLTHLAAASWPQARLWLAGENRAGVKSAGRVLAAHYARVEKRDNARHCVLYECSEPRSATPFEPEAYRSEMLVETPSGPLRVTSWPGVFAHGKLDEGTAMLLGHLPELGPGQRALDFGAGNGVLGACLARDNPEAQVVLCDSQALALRSARATLDLSGLAAEVCASDGLSGLEGRFDLVVSNPPFHHGHATVPDLSLRLLAPLRNFLNPGGQLLLVANRHLPYPQWLDQAFGSHAVLESNPRYHVLSALMGSGLIN